MAKPLRSTQSGPPKSMQFAHFGVLDDGSQNKASTLTSVAINIGMAFVIIVLGAAAKKSMDKRMLLTELTAPIPIKKIEPLKPKIVPPKVLPKLPEIPKVEIQPTKIVIPQTKLPEVPKEVIKMDPPKPVLMPAPALKVVAQAAPQVVNLSHPTPPALVNNSAHPTAVALGSANNPLPTSAGPAAINLGNKGIAGMPSSNTGLGKPTTVNLAGNGSPGGSNKGVGVVAVAGIPHGVPGGTGPANGTGRQVNLGQVEPPPMPKPATASAPVQHSAPKVIYKPKPQYTAEAMQLHLEGTVTIRIRVLPDGSVEVLGVANGLGHGLDESAKRAIEATKFEPATDASGHPIAWEGIVNVAFQLAG